MSSALVNEYKRYVRKRILFIAASAVALVALAAVSLVCGSADITLSALGGWLSGEGDPFVSNILLNIRLPRVVGAILSGTALAISGAAVQSLLHNPLASPYTLGISGAAAFGAAFAIVVPGAGSFVTLSAFAWSLAGIGLILVLSKYKGATPEMIILSGIILSSLFTAGISAMQYVADNVQLASIVFWTFGDLGRASWENIRTLSILLIPVIIFFLLQVWTYKSLHAGDEHAQSLGVDVKRVRLLGMVVATLATAAVVSFYGVIAFVGLVVPHIVRRMIGSDEQFLLPASAVFGGAFLLLSDTLARTVIAPVVLPVGLLTSFIGAPLFLFLLIKNMNRTY